MVGGLSGLGQKEAECTEVIWVVVDRLRGPKMRAVPDAVVNFGNFCFEPSSSSHVSNF